jgi:hypothetical protein
MCKHNPPCFGGAGFQIGDSQSIDSRFDPANDRGAADAAHTSPVPLREAVQHGRCSWLVASSGELGAGSPLDYLQVQIVKLQLFGEGPRNLEREARQSADALTDRRSCSDYLQPGDRWTARSLSGNDWAAFCKRVIVPGEGDERRARLAAYCYGQHRGFHIQCHLRTRLAPRGDDFSIVESTWQAIRAGVVRVVDQRFP